MSSSHLNVEKFRRKTTREPEEPRQAFQVFLCHPFKVHFYRHVPPVDCSNTSNFLRTTIDFTLRNKCCHLCHPRKDLEEHFYLV
eukprot:04589.XXX_28788_28423_1 [CDS] Oithona nana genome sequencing.